MNEHEIRKSQWNKNHELREFVSDTSLNYILSTHEISYPNNKLILDIGVGGGDLIKSLSIGNTMIGVDVSDVLLKTVEKFCKATYLSEDINKIEPVDLSICNLVMQHNHEYEVTRIINDTNLKNDGMFSFQFASLNIEKSVLTPLILKEINNSMLYFYSIEKMRSIVERTNKKIIKEIGPIWFDSPFNFEWFIFHVIDK